MKIFKITSNLKKIHMKTNSNEYCGTKMAVTSKTKLIAIFVKPLDTYLLFYKNIS